MNKHFDPMVIGRNQRQLFEMERDVDTARDNFELAKKKLNEMNNLIRRLEANSTMDREDLVSIKQSAAVIASEVEKLERDLVVMDQLLNEAQRVCQND